MPSASNYRYYGGRGIVVCARWHSYANFLADMGECPDPSLTLDRIDNAKGYEPGNCRWLTQAEQNANREHGIKLTHDGKTKSVAEWAAEVGMAITTLSMRVKLGWTTERALTQPIKQRTCK